MDIRVKNIAGRQFGRLSVKEYAGMDKRHNALWSVQCACGTEFVTRGERLRAGRAQSCGCLRKEMTARLGRNSSLGPNVSARNRILVGYKYAAVKRGLGWGLSEEMFDALIADTCRYCGDVPTREYHKRKTSLIYNGIDRVDNAKGYTPENVVTCCATCNWMKRNMSVEEFKKRITKIHSHFCGNYGIMSVEDSHGKETQ